MTSPTEYRLLEAAEEAARHEFRAARRALEYKRVPAGAQARYDAALEALRIAGKARFDAFIDGSVIVNAGLGR
jgi:hypothetical protein